MLHARGDGLGLPVRVAAVALDEELLALRDGGRVAALQAPVPGVRGRGAGGEGDGGEEEGGEDGVGEHDGQFMYLLEFWICGWELS